MGGNRPKNHISAKYVVVIDRRQGYIYYYALDKSGVLIYENGQPKLEQVLPYSVQSEINTPNSDDNENNENSENTENSDDVHDVEIKAPLVQENEENLDDSDTRNLREFQFYDEFNYENPFGFEDSWGNYSFEY